MVHVETGVPFTVDFIFGSPFGLRQETPLMNAMNRVGIATTARNLETSNWLYRMRNGKFEGGQISFVPNNIPGVMLRNRLGSESADSAGGQNWNRIRDPAVDALIEHVMAARTPEDFYAATRALDRILLWSFYYIPGLGAPGYRLVYWDRFGQPEDPPSLLRPAWLDTWWWDEVKAERVTEGPRGAGVKGRLTGRSFVGRGPWGRGHFALAMRRKAHWFERGLGPCAPGGACEGKMPSPPKGPSCPQGPSPLLGRSGRQDVFPPKASLSRGLLAFLRRVADGVGVGLGVVLAFLRWGRGFRQDDSGFGAGHDVVGLLGG